VLTVLGGSLLWVGWFGFNAGSALAANGAAGMALAVTQIASAAAALSWMGVEWAMRKKPSVLGIVSGAVAGLVAITPAAGFVTPTGALLIGFAAGAACWFGATTLKRLIGCDDALDVFGVHGVGGIVGALLTGVFAAEAIGGKPGLIEGNAAQLWAQAYGLVVTIVYGGAVSFAILKAIDWTVGLRVGEEVERDGLDLALHGETVA
jgi:Amt family ammonium transporter